MTRPCLRWAGGKSWLVKHLGDLLPKNGYMNYHEPFLGGASVFLYLKPQATSYLSDLNSELISTYTALRDRSSEVIKILESYQNTEEFYYKMRAQESNTEAERAARFIYLNQTSFNGIYRVNIKGKYNVPYGHRKKNFLNKDGLLSVGRALQGAVLRQGDFDIVRENLHEHDLVFLDPPYTVSHNDNGFIEYNQTIFSLDDQVRLSELVRFINDSGAYYILTNAAHRAIEEIFDNGDRRIELRRASTIGGVNAQRGQTSEYLFTNIA